MSLKINQLPQMEKHEKTEAIVYGGSAWDEFAAMQISSAGDIYICGNTKGYLAASHAGGLVGKGHGSQTAAVLL
jgi:hypothetical protein